jgi:hypothetical protein
MKSLNLLFLAGIGAAALGCDSQVGPEFEGESQFSLGGELVLGENSRELVPALAFWLPKTNEFAIVDVDVTGSFPANFRLDVLAPPPAGALFDYRGAKVAPAELVVVPKDHPRTYPFSSHGVSISCAQDKCTVQRSACTGDNCFEQDLECKPFDPCTLISETGNPNLATESSARSSDFRQCGSDHCISMTRACVDSGECHEVVKSCPLDREYREFEDLLPNEVTDCTVTAERGDKAWAKRLPIDEAVADHDIIYVSDPVELTDNHPALKLKLERGYNLVRVVDAADDETWVASIRCEQQAEQRARLAFDRKHGTMTASADSLVDLDSAQLDELTELVLAEAKDCPRGLTAEVVANPETANLKLRMGPRSSSAPL